MLHTTLISRSVCVRESQMLNNTLVGYDYRNQYLNWRERLICFTLRRSHFYQRTATFLIALYFIQDGRTRTLNEF